MKKVYLSAALFLFTGILIGQQTNTERVMKNIEPQKRELRSEFNQDRAEGDIIVSDDFANSANWIFHTDANGYQFDWLTSTPTTPTDVVFYMGSMASTTFANGFAFFNGIHLLVNAGTTPFFNQDVLLEYGSSINCTGLPGVILEFEQRYRAFNSDSCFVQATNDNWATYEEWYINGDAEGNGPTLQETEVLNISSVAGNEANVKIRFRWKGGDDQDFGAGYGWGIDDFAVREAWNYETALLNPTFRMGSGANVSGYARGLDYHMVALSQVHEIEFAAELQNNGGMVQTGSNLSVDITGQETANVTSTNVDIAVGATDSIVVGPTFTPSMGVGTYNMEFNANQTNPDHDPSNNTYTNSFQVTEYIYGRDNGAMTGSISNTTSNTGLELTIGNSMEFFGDAVAGKMEIVITDESTNEGQTIYGRIFLYDDNANEFNEIAVTEEYEIQSTDLGNAISIPIVDGPISFTAGQEVLVTAAHYGGNPEVEFGMAQPVEESTVFGYTGDGSFFRLLSPNAIMVRLDLRDFTSVDETEANSISVSQNVPNPFNDNSKITYSLNETSNVSLEIVDVTGKVVATYAEGIKPAGEYSINISGDKLSNGVYFYTFRAGEYSATKRMVVSK